MTNRVNLAKSKSEYTRAYEKPRGVDFSEIENTGTKLSYIENMYVDYDGGADAIETIPGYRPLYSYGEWINAIHLQDLGERGKYLLIHSGTSLFRFNIEDRDSLKNQEMIAVLEDRKSHSFSVGEFTYIMDGTSMLQIDSNGVTRKVSDNGEAPPHIPVTYENGIKKEGRNLLTDKYVQKFDITSTEKYAFYTKGLTFAVNDEKNRCCSVTGGQKDYNGDLYIPSFAIIDGIEYKVTEVAPSAFRGYTSITSVYGGANLEYIGKYAFMDCPCLEYAVFQNALKHIDYCAFCNSAAFREIYIGLGFEKFEENAIMNCDITFFHYAGDEHDAEKIIGIDQFSDANFYYLSVPRDVRFGFPINGDVATVDEVLIGGEATSYIYYPQYKELCVHHIDRFSLLGKEVIIKGTLKKGQLSADAILGCTVSCAHDGRIFLSGNPKLPSHVFYSPKNPIQGTFFSESDYFTDGVVNSPITALLSANGSLNVFKSQDDGSGSIFCHTASGSDEKNPYPVTYTYGGITGSRAAYVISDDAVFLSQDGLLALEKVSTNGYRELSCRSLSVNRRLLEEKLSRISITEWCGYLVLCTGERFYLADRRNNAKSSQSDEYDWYFLNHIGIYVSGDRVYRYSPSPRGPHSAHPTLQDERAHGTVMSVMEHDELLFYVEGEDGIKYSVYPTDEFADGFFAPAVYALGVDKLLFFGTESGHICVFNNDKRGVAPDYISSAKDFDKESYAEIMGDKIHPYFYTFDNRPIKCSIKTASDDCSIPHLSKSTVKHSLVVKCKNYAEGGFIAEAVTDHGKPSFLGKYSTSRMIFSDMNFGNLNFTTAPYSIIQIPENERNWVEKQLLFSSDCFRCPFGICSITYRYKIKGNIKYD